MVRKLDLLSFKWECFGNDLRFDRRSHTACYFKVRKQILLFGGKSSNSTHNDVTVFNAKDETLQVVNTSGHPPTARFSHCATEIGETMFVFGGYGRNEESRKFG